MTISSIGSSIYYMGQMSATWSRSASAGMSGRMAQNTAMGDRPNPAEMFSKVDQDSSGGLDQTEFQTLADKISEATGEKVDVEALFATYDADGDGLLSEDETRAAMKANRPEGPPPPGGMTAQADGSRSTSSSVIESYLKMAALGNGQDQASNMLAMFGGNTNDDGALFSVNTTA